MNQDYRKIIDIRTGETRHNQAVNLLQRVISIVVSQDVLYIACVQILCASDLICTMDSSHFLNILRSIVLTRSQQTLDAALY